MSITAHKYQGKTWEDLLYLKKSMKHGTYRGTDLRLLNKTALLMEGDSEGEVLAQFDDGKIPEGFGWREFDVADFLFDEELRDDRPNQEDYNRLAQHLPAYRRLVEN